MKKISPSLLDRYKGTLVGLACGDAVGTTVEFSPRESFVEVNDMRGGGIFQLKPGQWTDDTSMALCLAESLLNKNFCDPIDQLNRYRNWYEWGYLSSTGNCFDIGQTVRDAISKFTATGEPFCGSTHPQSAGNGSIMRLAPIVMFYYSNHSAVMENAAISSRTTHGAAEAIECCQLLADYIFQIYSGTTKPQLQSALKFTPSSNKVLNLTDNKFLTKDRSEIRGTGYCVESLEAALWCFFNTSTFEEAILMAANLGDDADTTAAVTGQLAGSYYGYSEIPEKWITQLSLREDIESMAAALFERSMASSLNRNR